MLLRSITKHVREQNWFAVALDFFIVVAGILIAFQITNWNEARGDEKLRVHYLERLQSDLTQTIDHFSANEGISQQKIETIDAFIANLNNQDTDENELIRTTTDYFSSGTPLFDFKVFRSTFDDLTSSGKLDILGSDKLSTALVTLNTNYADQNEDNLVNTDWVLPADASVVMEFDWFRFDKRTTHLFPSKSSKQILSDIRLNEDRLRRHAGVHYAIGLGLKRDFREMVNQSQEALDLVNEALEKR